MGRHRTRFHLAVFAVVAALLVHHVVHAQSQAIPEAAVPPSPDAEDLSPAPEQVTVQPVARDDEIRQRITSVLSATGWFVDPQVRVDDGVVFLGGRAKTEELRQWAGDLARNTQGVAAVANTIEVLPPSAWDFSAGWRGLRRLWQEILGALPMFVLGVFILGVFTVAGWITVRGVRRVLATRIRAKLLRGLLSRGAGILVLLLGVYIVLRISGLTQLALTIVGGTGLVGLAVGIAFREITENYLASIFLSMQQPFKTGDLVEIAGVTGYVRQLNVRTTVLMTLDGSVTQLPNGLVYRSTIRNFTTNPNRRDDFIIGIGYDDRIDEAQRVALAVLSGHPAVLDDPEPWVLAEDLGRATVNLRIYFWINGAQHSFFKVRSSVIRLVKRAFQAHGISMPDEAREVIFPRGVPVTLHEATPLGPSPASPQPHTTTAVSAPDETEEVSTEAEGGLSSEATMLDEQARQSSSALEKENLLQDDPIRGGRSWVAH